MLSNTPKMYSHAELYQPAKPVQQKPVQAAPVNPYQKALYECGDESCVEPVKQEPVAWRYNSNGDWIYKDRKVWDDAEPLYAAPVNKGAENGNV